MLAFNAQQVALMIQGKVEGDATVEVTQFGKIEEAKQGEISFLANPKYEEFLYSTKASVIIINDSQVLKEKIAATLIRVPDAYAAFEETAQPDGSPSLETGRRYREAILEAGGSRPALASFVAFRGREPTLNALLRHQGMTAPQASISGS